MQVLDAAWLRVTHEHNASTRQNPDKETHRRPWKMQNVLMTAAEHQANILFEKGCGNYLR
jgi:hypothetical protein